MARWSRIKTYPRMLKELQFWAWQTPWRTKLSGFVDRLFVTTRRQAARRGAAVTATLIVAASGAAAQTRTYDATLGTLPDSQGWTSLDTGGSPTPTVANGLLYQGPTSYSNIQFWQRTDVAIDFSANFTLRASLRVVSSTYHDDGVIRRAGFVFGVTDLDQQTLVLGITETGVFLGTENGWYGTTLIPLTTNLNHVYRLDVSSGVATLVVDGSTIATLIIGNPEPLYSPNIVGFGDGTGSGDCQIELGYVTYAVTSECDPGTDCNTNGTADDCDIAAGASADCDTNGTPDECQLAGNDCNTDAIPDNCQVADNDCDTNGVPDECQGVQSGEDYDGDGLIDPCDPDIDDDGVANAADVCDFTPSGATVQPDGSLRSDIDGDCDVDLADHAIMAQEFTGPRT